MEAIRKSQVVGSPIGCRPGSDTLRFAHNTSGSVQKLATFLYPAANLCNHDFDKPTRSRDAEANIAERG
jgi:hypothetical protein